MIPYFPQPVWSAGPLTIHAFGAASSVALVIGYVLVLRRAPPRYGIDSTHAGSVFIGVLAGALIAGFMSANHWGDVSGSGFAAGGAAILLAAAWRDRSWNLLDLIGGVVPLMNTIARIGCFLAHDHVGRLTGSWLGVQFPGGNRYDLGLLYALSAAAVAVIVEMVGVGAPGFIFGLMTALMAITRLIILRMADHVSLADQILAGVVFVTGCQIAVAARFRAASY